MLEKQIAYRQQIDEFGNVHVQKVTQILEDGKIHSEKYHRHVVHPGVSTTKEDAVTKKIAKAVHTPEVIAAHETKMAELEVRRLMEAE